MHTNNCEHLWSLMAKKLAGEATAEELQELELLLRENPQYNFSKEILLDFWQAEMATDNQYAENKYRELVQQIKNKGLDGGNFKSDDHYLDYPAAALMEESMQKRPGKKLVIGSLLVACIALAFYFIRADYKFGKQETNAGISASNEITTKSGSKTNLLLPDGTKVWLNANSKITYDKNYGNRLREVMLTGEAYFDVVKNAERPFVIHTAKMDIKVLGTAFNVKCYPGEKTTETSLIRGSIEVTLKDRLEKIMLKPNEKLVINNDEIADQLIQGNSAAVTTAPAKKENPIISLSHLTFYPADSTVIETAWTQNKLVFSSETFEEIALKMERWYNVKIGFADEYLKNERLTGNFEKETITEALTAMQLTTAFSFIIKNDKILIKQK